MGMGMLPPVSFASVKKNSNESVMKIHPYLVEIFLNKTCILKVALAFEPCLVHLSENYLN